MRFSTTLPCAGLLGLSGSTLLAAIVFFQFSERAAADVSEDHRPSRPGWGSTEMGPSSAQTFLWGSTNLPLARIRCANPGSAAVTLPDCNCGSVGSRRLRMNQQRSDRLFKSQSLKKEQAWETRVA